MLYESVDLNRNAIMSRTRGPLLERERRAASGMLHSEYRQIPFTVDPIDPAVSIDADPQLLMSAVTNLLHNVENTASRGRVALRARAEHSRLLIETEDECGGIPPGNGDLFPAFGVEGTILDRVLETVYSIPSEGPDH